MHKIEDFVFEKLKLRYAQLFCLVLMAIAQIVLMSGGLIQREPIQYLLRLGSNMVGCLFLGLSFAACPRGTGRKVLLLGMAVCGWILLLQLSDMRNMETFKWEGPRFLYTTFLCEYLLCLPFAAVSDEKGRNTGFRIFALMILIQIGIYCVLTAAIYLGRIPVDSRTHYDWMGTRLRISVHPNILAAVLLIGLGVCTAWIAGAKTVWMKLVFSAAALAHCFLITLTNTRAVIIMACCILGGVVFFLIYRNVTRKNMGWKFAAGLAAAILSIAALFMLSDFVYQVHCRYVVEQTIETRQEEAEEAAEEAALAGASGEAQGEEAAAEVPARQETQNTEAPTEPADEAAVAEEIRRASGQGSLAHDIGHLNGRTMIWSSAFRHLAEEPEVLLFGTRDVGEFAGIYNRFPVMHAHNSWVQTLLSMGVVGLLFALYLTYLAVRSCLALFFFRQSHLYQKIMGLTVIAVLGSQFFEPYLFAPNCPYNYINLLFLFCLGYVIYWAENTPKQGIPD